MSSSFEEWVDERLEEPERFRDSAIVAAEYPQLLKLVRAYHELDCINAELYPDADWKKRGEIAALEAALMGDEK